MSSKKPCYVKKLIIIMAFQFFILFFRRKIYNSNHRSPSFKEIFYPNPKGHKKSELSIPLWVQ